MVYVITYRSYSTTKSNIVPETELLRYMENFNNDNYTKTMLGLSLIKVNQWDVKNTTSVPILTKELGKRTLLEWIEFLTYGRDYIDPMGRGEEKYEEFVY